METSTPHYKEHPEWALEDWECIKKTGESYTWDCRKEGFTNVSLEERYNNIPESLKYAKIQ